MAERDRRAQKKMARPQRVVIQLMASRSLSPDARVMAAARHQNGGRRSAPPWLRLNMAARTGDLRAQTNRAIMARAAPENGHRLNFSWRVMCSRVRFDLIENDSGDKWRRVFYARVEFSGRVSEIFNF